GEQKGAPARRRGAWHQRGEVLEVDSRDAPVDTHVPEPALRSGREPSAVPLRSLRRGRAAEQRSHRSREDPRRTHGARPSEYTVTAHRARAPWEVHLHPHRVVYRRTRAGRAHRRGDEHECEEHGDSHTPSVT